MVAPVMAGRPRGTTQVVTRGTTNDWYEVTGTRVPGVCQSEVVVWRSKAIMRRLVDGKKTKIPSDLAI
ncbi:hypothetical protein Tco_1340010 [Tanacetum coccineum]